MHLKPIHYLVFVIIMGPLIWLSQHLHWGPTGTFVCVMVSVVFGGVLVISGKLVSRRLKQALGGNRGAAADFLFGPTHPQARLPELHQAHRQIVGRTRVSEWNAPALPMRQPLLPHPHRRPASPYTSSSAPVQVMPAPTYSHAKGSRGRLTLGPSASMVLESSLTSGLVVETPRRPIAAVFFEEWCKLGLGMLVVDLYGQYAAYLARLSPGFGFLAGSVDAQDQLGPQQQGRYMPLAGTLEAMHVGAGIVEERLQIIFDYSSYKNPTEAGTILLALLSSMEKKARLLAASPCAILLTDTQPLMPADEEDCLIPNMGVAQQTYDLLITMLEHAGGSALRNLALYLATSTIEDIDEEALDTCHLWIVRTSDEAEVQRISSRLELSEEEAELLQDGEVLLLDTTSDGAPQFLRFRRSAILLKPVAAPSKKEEERLGERQGLGIKQET
jgi:hypothetical protein